jgi:hypothetical protein
MPIRTWQAGLMTVLPVAALRFPPRALGALRCSAEDGS